MELLQLLPLVGIALLFYLMIVRPTQRRNRELVAMQSSLSVGDDVLLTSGVHGTLTGLGEDHVFVEIAEGVIIKVARGAIGNVHHETTTDNFEEAEINTAPRAEDS